MTILLVQDLITIGYWGGLWLLIGLTSLPLTWRFFDRLWDRGSSLAPWLGALGVAHLVWLGGYGELWTVSRMGVFWAWGIWLGVNGYIWIKCASQLKRVFKTTWVRWLWQSGIWMMLFTLIAVLRGFAPNFDNLEKFMDLGLVQSSLRSNQLPPLDLWQAGASVNYYYFGHFLTAMITKLSGLEGYITVNLMVATVVSTILVMGGSLGLLVGRTRDKTNETKAVRMAWAWRLGMVSLGVWLLGVRGNLYSVVYSLMKPWGWTIAGFANTYWFADATRMIPGMVYEFPSYSFIVADLHAHVLNLPTVLIFLAGLWQMGKASKDHFFHYGFLGWLLGIMAMTNTWDALIYGSLGGVVVGYLNFVKPDIDHKRWRQTLIRLLQIALVAIGSSVLFWLDYQSAGYTVAWVETSSHILPWMVQWGWDVVVTCLFIGYLLRNPKRSRRDWVVLGLYGFSWALVSIPEIGYLQTVNPQFGVLDPRANTMFKLGFQAWVLLSLAHGYSLIRIGQSIWHKPWLRGIGCLGISLSIWGLSWVSWDGVWTYYQGFSTYQGLDASSWLHQQHPEDWALIAWLTNKPLDGVVLEASGESYSYAGRISVYSGLPTVQGWLFHEWHWRGGDPVYFLRREQDVATIYNSEDLAVVAYLLAQYHIRYIVVGELEHKSYELTGESAFTTLATPVFEMGSSLIYEVK